MDTYRRTNVALLAATMITVVGAFGYSTLVCQKHYGWILCGKGILSPLETAGLVLSIFFAVFLFLPSHYFRSWMIWVCSWAMPIMLFFVLTATGRGFDFSKSEMIEFLSRPFAFITLVFLIGRFLWLRRKGG